jgi:hypothetical protein
VILSTLASLNTIDSMPERRDQWSDLGADHAGDDADGGARPEIIGKLVVKSRVKCWAGARPPCGARRA